MSDELVPITVKVRREMLAAIDSAQSVHGEGRAQFIRNAIAERVALLGVSMAQAARFAPDRAGKGGQPTHKRNRAGAGSASPAVSPFSFPVTNSVGDGKTGQKREIAADVASEVGTDYEAPTAVIPVQQISTEDPVQGVSPSVAAKAIAAAPGALATAKRMAAEERERAAKRAAAGLPPRRPRGGAA